jgi:hypothetical protein
MIIEFVKGCAAPDAPAACPETGQQKTRLKFRAGGGRSSGDLKNRLYDSV